MEKGAAAAAASLASAADRDRDLSQQDAHGAVVAAVVAGPALGPCDDRGQNGYSDPPAKCKMQGLEPECLRVVQ